MKLFNGLFWFKNLDDIKSNAICFLIPCDEYGNSDLSEYDNEVISKDGKSLNHKKLWESLSSKITDNKNFDYYPHGRVEINKNKATIYVSQCLVEYEEELMLFCKNKFNLTSDNGINSIKIFVDGSEHYRAKMFESLPQQLSKENRKF